MEGRTKVVLLKAVADIPEKHFAEKIRLMEELNTSLTGDQKVSLVNEVINILGDDLFGKRVGLIRQLSKGMNGTQKIALVKAIKKIPREDYEKRVEILEELYEGLEGYQKNILVIDLIHTIAKVPGDDHIRERAGLYLHLNQEIMNPEQRSLLLDQLCNFTAIRQTESWDDLANDFITFLESRIEEDLSVQDFAFAFRENPVDWMPTELVSMATLLINQRDRYTVRSSGEIAIRANRELLKEKPEEELKKLIHAWQPKRGNKLRLGITFQDKKNRFESGI
ncbi:MAG: hypothetical protein O2779_05625, partial [Nanoarchaeota archaeon]|nr:hypothetical protein [Nanoarchaeota archaeon]